MGRGGRVNHHRFKDNVQLLAEACNHTYQSPRWKYVPGTQVYLKSFPASLLLQKKLIFTFMLRERHSRSQTHTAKSLLSRALLLFGFLCPPPNHMGIFSQSWVTTAHVSHATIPQTNSTRTVLSTGIKVDGFVSSPRPHQIIRVPSPPNNTKACVHCLCKLRKPYTYII